MGKKTIIALVAIVVVLAGGGALLAAHNNTASTKDHTKTDMTKPMDMNRQPQTSNNATATSSVTIDNFAFAPASITVKKGTTVTWTNKDSATHTVTESDGQDGPDSGDLAHGKSYSFTYDTAGTFKYHCAIHPDMLGTVIVTE
jgi:plastocyanin